jgi:ankyrin repeat protein
MIPIKASYLILTLLLLIPLIPLSGCKPKEEVAREKLERMGYKYNERPFLRSVKDDDIAAVKLFLDSGMTPNAKDYFEYTALAHAANLGHAEIVKMLLEAGADANAKTKYYGRTPIILAALNGHLDVVKILINSGADVNHIGTDGVNALIFAVDGDNLQIAGALLDAGADVNRRVFNDTTTPLLRAVGKGNTQMVKLLIKAGADVNARDTTNVFPAPGKTSEMTPLILASSKGQIEIVKALIEAGAEVNAKNASGSTALSIANGKGNKEIAELLIQKGAEEVPTPTSSPTSGRGK